MAAVEKLPSGNWRGVGYIRVGGKRYRKSFTVSPDEEGSSLKAKKKALFLAEQWERETGRSASPLDISVRKAVENYVDSRTAVLSPSTMAVYKRMKGQLGAYPALMELRVSDVSTPDIQNVINAMAITLSTKTIKNRITFLISCLEYAGNEKKFKLAFPRSVPPDVRVPDAGEVSRLLRESSGELKIAIALAAFGTLRRGEICALTYSDILRDLRSVSVTKDKVETPEGGYVVKQIPKTAGSVRTVRLPAEVINLIPQGDPGDEIIANTPSGVSHGFERLAKKLGINCAFHDLRHYSASFRSDLGIPAKYIEEVGGWVGESRVLQEVYDNPLAESRKKYTDIANQYIVDTFCDVLSKTG